MDWLIEALGTLLRAPSVALVERGQSSGLCLPVGAAIHSFSQGQLLSRDTGLRSVVFIWGASCTTGNSFQMITEYSVFLTVSRFFPGFPKFVLTFLLILRNPEIQQGLSPSLPQTPPCPPWTLQGPTCHTHSYASLTHTGAHTYAHTRVHALSHRHTAPCPPLPPPRSSLPSCPPTCSSGC